MTHQVKIPVMDQTTETVTLAAWLVQEGAAVKSGDVLCEIETEKATVEINAPADGIVRKIFVEKGAEIPPKTVVALIGDANEALPDVDPFYQTARAKLAAVAAAPAAQSAVAAPTAAPTKVIASPRARKLAEDNGIDLSKLTPGGPDGRIVEDDVKAAIQTKASKPASADTPSGKIARAKAERVSLSWQTIPHFYMSVTADLSQIVAAKDKAGKSFTFTDYFVVALAKTLTKHPQLNGYWEDNAASLVLDVRVGIVVQTERGLLIPALRDVRHRSVREIAAEREQVVSQALAGKLSGDVLAEPTFTISNVGAGHIDSFTAIISPPQLAILSVGSVMPRPVVVGETLVVRPTATFTLGVDHRAIDGKQSAAFLEELKQNLESF